MTFSELGIAANDCWLEIPTHFPNTVLHEYVIMPNHIHGIIEIVDNKQNDDNDLKNGGSNDNDNNANNNVGAKNFSPPHNNPRPSHIDQHDPSNNISYEFTPLHFQKIDENTPAAPFRSPSRTIGSIVRGFKIGVTKLARQKNTNTEVWQRNYYEHIIRNEKSYIMISEYIRNNPAAWEDDKFYI